jgi:histidyl-tRNA synthetase
MKQSIQAIRGMNDILPTQTAAWQKLERVLKQLAQQYAYHEIRFPIVEQSKLFKRSIGDATDIVEKEMYTFDDRNGDSLSLRPEGTASCMRAAIQHSLFYGKTQRLWYLGPFFRHERPQKGRYRQFHQYGMELIGSAAIEADAELILLSARLFKQLGLDQLKLEINSMGSIDCRQRYRKELVQYLEHHATDLDQDSQRRLHTNPLRILDSKNPDMQTLIAKAPKLIDHLSDERAEAFKQLCQHLDHAHIKYTINPCIVRGLDYYNDTVFEWTSEQLGAQGTVCAGGRYDGLIEQLGGQATPAVGFALGMERLLSLLETTAWQPSYCQCDLYLIAVGDRAQSQAPMIAEQLREQLPEHALELSLSSGSLKSQLKKADKSGAAYALILGDDEVEKQCLTLKALREQEEQQTLTMDALIHYLLKKLKP